MKVCNSDIVRATPPWLSVVLEQPMESKHVEEPGNGGYTNPFRMGMTKIRLGHQTLNGYRKTSTEEDVGEWELSKYKQQFKLINEQGAEIFEPDEDNLSRIVFIRSCCIFLMVCFNSLVFVLFLLWMLFRFYLYSCYHQWTIFTMANLKGHEFPLSIHEMNAVEQQCENEVLGAGMPLGVPCKPDREQIEGMCLNRTLGCAKYKMSAPSLYHGCIPQRPQAGKMLLQELFAFPSDGLRCTQNLSLPFLGQRDLCQFRNDLVYQYDPPLLRVAPYIGQSSTFLAIVIVLLSMVFKCLANSVIRKMKDAHLQPGANSGFACCRSTSAASGWKPTKGTQVLS